MNKSCAHCGGDGVLKGYAEGGFTNYAIKCLKCGAMTEWHLSEEAWEAWNKKD